MSLRNLTILAILPFLIAGHAFSENNYSDSLPFRHVSVVFPNSEQNPDDVTTFLQRQLESFQKDGYLDARLDSISTNIESITGHFFTGHKFHYLVNISHPSLKTIFQEQARKKSSDLLDISFQDFNIVSMNILSWYSDNGFPFARLLKTNMRIVDYKILFDLEAEPGDLVVFGSIHTQGNARINRRFTERYLDIAPGKPFSQRTVNQTWEKLSRLDFVRPIAPVQLSFTPGKANLIIPIEKSLSHKFDGIAGLSGGDDTDKPIEVTGLLNFFLSNAFGMGENIDVAWQAPGNKTKILRLAGGYPYPFNLPIETDLLFSIHRQDTSWLKVEFKPGLSFLLRGNSKFGLFWHYTNNTLIVNALQSSNSGFMNFTSSLYGIDFKWSSALWNRNPISSGFSILLSAGAGTIKKPTSNAETAEVLPMAEKSGSLATFQSNIEQRWKTGNRATFSGSIISGWLSGKNLPANQLMRLGGFKSVKGFDELSLHASAYSIASLEFRFFTSPQSYINLFANGGWLEEKSISGYKNTLLSSIGTGLNLQTAAGVFSVSVALGRKKNIPQGAKIHLGYITTF